MKSVDVKNLNNILISKHWDDICALRDTQIKSGIDVSYSDTLQPFILDRIKNLDKTKVLDLGCGTGILSSELAKHSHYVTAIDISSNSINIAKNNYSKINNINFINTDIVNLQETGFNLIISNMVFQDILNIDECLQHMIRVTDPSATIIATFTHPCFWPIYWNYSSKEWFNYNNTIAIVAPFKIQNDTHCDLETIHIHRSIECYFNLFSKYNLRLLQFNELSSFEIADKEGNISKFPKFLGIVLSRS